MMTVPVSYTNIELAEYMERTIGSLSSILSLDAYAGGFDDAVHSTLLALGVSDAESVDDIPRLRAYAEREVWRLARDRTVAHYDLRSPDGEQLSRSQLHAHCVRKYQEVDAEIAKLEGAMDVQRAVLVRLPDPYRRWRANGEFG